MLVAFSPMALIFSRMNWACPVGRTANLVASVFRGSLSDKPFVPVSYRAPCSWSPVRPVSFCCVALCISTPVRCLISTFVISDAFLLSLEYDTFCVNPDSHVPCHVSQFLIFHLILRFPGWVLESRYIL